jgi:hypothetical protein
MADDLIKPGGNGVPVLPFSFRLRASPYVVPAGWPPDVAPNQLIEADHLNRIRTSVYSWPGDVDGLGHTLSNVNLVNATGVMHDPMTTAGDIIARDTTGPSRLPIGTSGQILMVDTALPSKVKWATPAPVVASVFGRTGVVVAAIGDYSAALVTNAVDATQSYVNPAWITSLAYGKLTGVPATFTPAAHVHDAADVTTGRFNTARLGSGIADANVYLRGDGSWAAVAGGGGGGAVASVFGRTGAVVAQVGDYTAAQVSGAVVDPTIAIGDLLVRGTTAIGRLPLGANGQILTADNAVAGGVRWGTAPGGPGLPGGLTNGDIAQWKSGAWQIVPVGTTGQVLMVDTAGNGLRWGAGGGGSQTPWLTDVDAANHALNNVSSIISNGPIKSNAGGFVFPDGSTQVSAAGQSPWNVDIDANNHTLTRLGRAPLAAVSSVGAGLSLAFTESNVINLDIATRRTALGTGHTFIEHRIQRGVDGTPQGYIAMRSGTPAVVIGYGVADFVTVTSAGNVGIGTASPNKRLEVFDAAVTQLNIMTGNNSGAIGLATNNNVGAIQGYTGVVGTAIAPISLQPGGGNIGIGTTTPRAALDFGMNISVDLLHLYDNGNNKYGMGIQTNEMRLYVDPAGAITFGHTTYANVFTERMRIHQNGGVGIGTASPAEKLHVTGNIALHSGNNASYYRLFCEADQTALRIGYWEAGAWYGGTPAISLGYSGDVTVHKTLYADHISSSGTVNLNYHASVNGNLYCSGEVRASGASYLQATNVTDLFVENSSGSGGTQFRLDGFQDHFYLVTTGGGDIKFQVVGVDALTVASGAITAGVNMQCLHSGLSGLACGTAIGGGTYGAIYWDSSDASINIYHSSIAGFPLKIRMDGGIAAYYLANVRGDAGPANSGRLYRTGNQLMIS